MIFRSGRLLRSCCARRILYFKNAFRGGSVFAEEAEGNVVFDVSGRTTALFGVRDLIVVHTADATLVCAKECAENLKSLVKKLPPNLR